MIADSLNLRADQKLGTSARAHGFPLYAHPCWYVRESKAKPLQRRVSDANAICVGIAADESGRCSANDFIRYPLVEWGWNQRDCAEYLRTKNPLNPIYERYNRLGCFSCPKQIVALLHTLWKSDKTFWYRARWWDEESRRLTGHGIKEKPFSDYETRFENGFIPNQKPEYACESCDAVGSAFRIRDAKLRRFLDTREQRHEAIRLGNFDDTCVDRSDAGSQGK